MIKASCGIYQKVDRRTVKVTASRIEVRYFLKAMETSLLII
jgi:hypothetical protein